MIGFFYEHFWHAISKTLKNKQLLFLFFSGTSFGIREENKN